MSGIWITRIRAHYPEGEPATMKYLDTAAVARRYGMSPRTLERWRLEGKGPVFCKFGRRVMYADDDLVAWELKQRRTFTSDAARAA